MRANSLLLTLLFLPLLPLRAQTLRAGFAKADITPVGPVYMAGYDMRDAPSDGIHGNDRLHVRALVFEEGRTRVAIVVANIIGIREHDEWRRRVADATGIPASHVLLGETHNHAAPSASARMTSPWEREFEKGLLDAVKQASAKLQPVRIAAGTGRSRVGMNRRVVRFQDSLSPLTFDENDRSQFFGKFKRDDPVQILEPGGVVRLGANPEGPMDETVQIVRLDTVEGKPLAVMIHYACHGTSLGGRNSKISAEWMGRMEEYVESRFPGLGAIYVQGAAGDVNPRVVGGLDGYQDDIEMTWALGEEIGAEAARVYGCLSPQVPARPGIQLETREILLPRQYRELFEDFTNTTVKVPTTVLRIAGMMWVTFPGEMFSSIGKQVKSLAPATFAHVMGYANGRIGYFPERKAYAEGGYEVASTHLDPASEQIYLREIAQLMKRFR